MTDADDKAIDRDLRLPTYYLIGFHIAEQKWRAVAKGLVSYLKGSESYFGGKEGYSRIMMVSQSEFRVLGLPKDEEATEYFSIEGQRRVSGLYGSNRGSKGQRKRKL